MNDESWAQRAVRQALEAAEDERAVIARGLAEHNAEMDLLSMSDEERAAWRAKLRGSDGGHSDGLEHE